MYATQVHRPRSQCQRQEADEELEEEDDVDLSEAVSATSSCEALMESREDQLGAASAWFAAPLHDGRGIFQSRQSPDGHNSQTSPRSTIGSFEVLSAKPSWGTDHRDAEESSSAREPLSPFLSGALTAEDQSLDARPPQTDLRPSGPRGPRRASEVHDLLTYPAILFSIQQQQRLLLRHRRSVQRQQERHNWRSSRAAEEEDLCHSVHAISAGLHRPNAARSQTHAKRRRQWSDRHQSRQSSSKRSRQSEQLLDDKACKETNCYRGSVTTHATLPRASFSQSRRSIWTQNVLRLDSDTFDLLYSAEALPRSVWSWLRAYRGSRMG